MIELEEVSGMIVREEVIGMIVREEGNGRKEAWKISIPLEMSNQHHTHTQSPSQHKVQTGGRHLITLE